MSLKFLQKILDDTISEDSLTVIANGLGKNRVLSNLLRIYCDSKEIIIVLNCSKGDEQMYYEQIKLSGHKNPPTIITNENSNERLKMYLKGGVFFISPRILVVDLLTSKLPSHLIGGILICNADYIEEFDGTWFTLCQYRKLNKEGFIKALSDNPQSLISEFGKTERLMKWMYLTKLKLFPRFHSVVVTDLDKNIPQIIEVGCTMTSKMEIIQNCIKKIIVACIKEISSSNSVELHDFNPENVLLKSYHKLLKKRLEPIWHKISHKNRQLLTDLNELRRMGVDLIHLDCISYNEYIESVRYRVGHHSTWMFLPEANTLFVTAKNRISFATSKQTKEETNEEFPSNSSKLTPSFEENPKWNSLAQILGEIKSQTKNRRCGNILIMVKDVKTCKDIKEYLEYGGKVLLEKKWKSYLEREKIRQMNKKRTNEMISENNQKRNPYSKNMNISTNNTNNTNNNNNTTTTKKYTKKQKNPVSMATFFLTKSKQKVTDDKSSKDKKPVVIDISKEEQQKKTEGKIEISEKEDLETTLPCNPEDGDLVIEENSNNEIIENNEKVDTKIDMVDEDEETQMTSQDLVKNDILKEKLEETKVESKNEKEKPQQKKKGKVFFENLEILESPYIFIKPIEKGKEKQILEEYEPNFIIMYHTNLAFVREIELWKAEKKIKNLGIYFLSYKNSIEENMLKTKMVNERNAFDELIKIRANMVVESTRDGKEDIEVEEVVEESSRIGGLEKRLLEKKRGEIVVDSREFRSKLPAFLYSKNYKLVPSVIEIGDYILSPQICVERKSVSDLISSFNDGRLFKQATNMCTHYENPILLIEFEGKTNFCLQKPSDIREFITPHDLTSKMVLLSLHFPKLRLFWSRNLLTTYDFFDWLKQQNEQPNLEKISNTGVDVDEDNFNLTPRQFLEKLPGITQYNVHYVLDKVDSLYELANLTRSQMIEILGKQNGALLYNFFASNTKYQQKI